MARSFSEAINQRNKNNIKSELTFIGFKESKLEKYEKIKTDFIATVKFASEIISVKKDKDNKVIEGNPDRIKTVTDHWKFTKNIFSKNPNWYLAEIIYEEENTEDDLKTWSEYLKDPKDIFDKDRFSKK